MTRRENWLFAGSDECGERAAAIYALTETAKLNGLDLEDHLAKVRACIADNMVVVESGACGDAWNSVTPPDARSKRHA